MAYGRLVEASPVEAVPVETGALEQLRSAYRPTATRFRPEDSPFGTVFADITHRCNMACKNCYIPVRDLPDAPIDWLYDVIARLPKRVRIRLVGAEPTMREDLPEIITRIRELGHIPVILSNGLKLGRRSYAERLKNAGLHTVYLSLNGGLRDDLYEEIDGVACADRKLKALDNLLALRMNVTTGTIVVPGVNDAHFAEFLPWLLDRGVREIHVRSVGQVGNFMKDSSLSLDQLETIVRKSIPAGAGELVQTDAFSSSREFKLGRALIQMTEWPELGSLERGRIAPDGFVEPMFESMVANEHRY